MQRFRWVIAAIPLFTGCPGPQHSGTTRLTVLGLSLQAGNVLRHDAIEEFTRKTGIDVDLIPTPGTSADQLAQIRRFAKRRSTTPDVYLIDIIWPATVHDDLLDLTPYLTAEARAHLPALVENNTIGGRLVALPFYMNTGMLYYRADLLKKYGYAAPPATWADLERMASRIQQGERRQGHKDFWGYAWQGAAYEGLTCNALEWQASFGGGHIIERNGPVTVDRQGAVRALANAANWIGTISPPSVLSYTESDTLNAFVSGHAAFARHWSSAFRGIRESMQAGAAGVAPIPAGPGGHAQTLGGFEFAVSRYSAHPREAADLVLYLTGAEVETRRALLRGYVPSYAHLYSRPDVIQAIPQVGVLQNTDPASWVVRPSAVSGDKYSEVSKAYYECVHEILSRKARAGTALPELARRLAEITGIHREAPDATHGR